MSRISHHEENLQFIIRLETLVFQFIVNEQIPISMPYKEFHLSILGGTKQLVVFLLVEADAIHGTLVFHKHMLWNKMVSVTQHY